MNFGIIYIINQYTATWDILLRYDENRLQMPEDQKEHHPYLKEIDEKDFVDIDSVAIEYEEARLGIFELKESLKETEFFGLEKDNQFQGILGNIMQTFDQVPLYPTIEEKASHLMYFIIKDHPFLDGNKRIGCLLFLMYLTKIGMSLETINDNALTAVALLIAESQPSQKDLIIDLIIRLLF
jgi:prophage maintenance system killer protein